jgi:hypothetical protein
LTQIINDIESLVDLHGTVIAVGNVIRLLLESVCESYEKREKMRSLSKLLVVLSFIIPLNTIAAKAHIEQEFLAYVKEFNEIHYRVCHKSIESRMKPNMPMMFADTAKMCHSSRAIGCCVRSGNIAYLAVDKSWWDNQDDHNRKMVLWHEMTHCIYDEDHVNNPNHYMYPSVTRVNEIDLYIQVAQYAKKNCSRTPDAD